MSPPDACMPPKNHTDDKAEQDRDKNPVECTFVFGESLPQEHWFYESIIKSHGGTVEETVSEETDYLVIGGHPEQTQFDAAAEYDVPVLHEGDFTDLLADHGVEWPPDRDDRGHPIDGGTVSKHLDGPLMRVRFRWDEPEGHDSYVVTECPYCGEEKHYHDANSHPTIALGGISLAQCPETGARYYLFLADNGRGPSAEFVHSARQELMNLPGDELRRPLVPDGIDPRIINEVIPNWSN